MFTTAFLFFKLIAAAVPPQPVETLVKEVADSGRCVTVATSPDQRVAPPKMVPAGRPPILSFRYYESKAHHQAGNSGLMLDDAGH